MWAYSFLSDAQRDSTTDIALVLGLFVALTAFYRSPWGKPFRFVVDKLFTEPRADRRRADITAVVAPLIDSAKAAALAQHDEQNNAIEQGFQSVHQRMDTIDHRLDAGLERFARHDQRMDDLEARPPSTRSRKDDQ